ncbi:MAG: hypothetical protein NT018_02120 [Armatimonadetes bacterium]|nr:hypothetical protein [Armatimonadota bacterium]
MDPLDYAQVFVASLNDQDMLARVYAEWLVELLKRPVWSPTSPEGRRIPWKMIAKAVETGSASTVAGFKCHGLYLWGANELVPRKIGKTKDTLDKRMKNRYIRSPRPRSEMLKYQPQCLLAADLIYNNAVRNKMAHFLCLGNVGGYREELRKNGLQGFPVELRDNYNKEEARKGPRLLGAADWIVHGIEGMWVAILPMPGLEHHIEKLEHSLQSIADEWNMARNYYELVND